MSSGGVLESSAMASLERRVAVDAARAAGRLLRDALRGSRRIAYKSSPINLVTEMDERAETVIVDALSGVFPDDAILAEERGASAGRSGRRWIIDPLDGTTNYAHGVPAFAVSIGLEADGRVMLGVVYEPNLDELFVAEHGRGAFLNDARITVSSTTTVDASLLATGFPYDLRDHTDNNLREYGTFSLRSRGVRRWGSAVIDLAWVAAGRFDGFWELRLAPWDVAAGMLITEEAGGTVTSIDGRPLDIDRPTVLATNGKIHQEMLDLFAAIRG